MVEPWKIETWGLRGVNALWHAKWSVDLGPSKWSKTSVRLWSIKTVLGNVDTKHPHYMELAQPEPLLQLASYLCAKTASLWLRLARAISNSVLRNLARNRDSLRTGNQRCQLPHVHTEFALKS